MAIYAKTWNSHLFFTGIAEWVKHESAYENCLQSIKLAGEGRGKEKSRSFSLSPPILLLLSRVGWGLFGNFTVIMFQSGLGLSRCVS